MVVDEFKEKCKRCGDCLDVCSQYSDINMIDSLIESIESGTESDFDISKCLTCGFCEATCPEGLSLKLLIKDARLNQVWKEGLSDINFLCDPYSDRNIFKFANEMEDPLVFEAKESDTVYFPGCYSTYFHKTMIQATMRLLEKAGIDFTVLNGLEYCCGVVPAGTGNPSVVTKNGPIILEKLKELGAKTVITSCPGCYMALARVYPSLFGEHEFEVIHASQYLFDLVESGVLKPGDEIGGEVFYHDPCHLTRGAGIHEEPRGVLKKMEDTDLINPTPDDSVCCGFGGGVRMNHPTESVKIARREHEAVEGRGAKAIITNCAGCRQNLLEGRPENGPMVYDLAEYLLLSMGEDVPRDDDALIDLVNACYEKGMRGYERPEIDK